MSHIFTYEYIYNNDIINKLLPIYKHSGIRTET